jgi:hypothetical protein
MALAAERGLQIHRSDVTNQSSFGINGLIKIW